MYKIIPLLLLFGCNNDKMFQAFIDTNRYGCMSLANVTYGNHELGNFVLCTKEEFKRRTEE